MALFLLLAITTFVPSSSVSAAAETKRLLRRLGGHQSSTTTTTTTTTTTIHSTEPDSFEAPEPFDYLNHVVCMDCNGPKELLSSSPDPLVRAKWGSDENDSKFMTKLQIYRITRPMAITIDPPTAQVEGIQDWLASNNDDDDDDHSTNQLIIKEPCNITIDWGTEHAGWFEFITQDDITNGLQAGISEFNTPYPGKLQTPTKYGKHTYRLETNKELYEGVRYTFFYYNSTKNDVPVSISNISLVSKIKPIHYSGYYHSSTTSLSTTSAAAVNKDILTKTWYTGAYGVRLNMESEQFNSILINRGDRVAIQGDGHPSMATALVGFGSPYLYKFVQNELWQTNSGHIHGHNVVDQSIMAYPLYWCLSVLDWYWASGNHTGFTELVPDVRSILDIRVSTFLDYTQDIVWMGWDDRLGNGWCFHGQNDTCPIEGHWTLAGLVARVTKDLARSLKAVGMTDLAKQYHTTHQALIQQFRTKVPTDQVGVHAAANMINADIMTSDDEITNLIQTKLNDVATICSWSMFNQYWILQAFAHDIERGLASVELCWGPMLQLNKGCFWELSGPDWTTFLKEGDMPPTMPSLCHPWASGVTSWLSHIHGGIIALQPGYKQVLLAPYVSINYPNVTTTIPYSNGSITVKATLNGDDNNDDDLILRIDDDDDTHILRIEVDSPITGGTYIGLRQSLVGAAACAGIRMDPTRIILNQQALDFSQLLTRHDLKNTLLVVDLPTHVKNMTFIRVPSAGKHSLSVAYSCQQEAGIKTIAAAKESSSSSPFPPAHYPASVSFDRESKGDGLFKHGTDGSLLLGYNPDQSDMENLPTYVKSIQIRNHGYNGWKELPRHFIGSSGTYPTFLPNPVDPSAPRALGKIGFGEPGYWDPGVLVDVELKEEARNAQESVLVDIQTTPQKVQRPYQLSIYCVGVGKHAVRIMDLESLDPIAPTVLVDAYDDGVWYTVSYNKSIRLRVMAMYGIQMSAIAFASPSQVETSSNGRHEEAAVAKVSPFPPAHYPASVSFDRTTRGEGLTTHGPDGYLLLGYNEDQSDLKSLPSYVKALQIRGHGYDGWDELQRTHVGSSTTNQTYIPNPINPSAPRALGVISQDDPGSQGFLIDVELEETERNAMQSIHQKDKPYHLSIYSAGIGKHAVRIMDGETFDPVAPTVLVDAYDDGIWYTISYNKSMRLRVMGIDGIQISAIAFASSKDALVLDTANQR